MTKKDLADLSPEARRWAVGILKTFVLESHHQVLLLTCAQCLDRITEAREAIVKDGQYYRDAHGVIRPHPAVKVEHDAKVLYGRALRELDLDAEVSPGARRPPAIRSNRTLTALRGGGNHAA